MKIIGRTLATSALLVMGLIPLQGGADTSTQILRQVTNIFPGDVNPCTGDAGTTTFTFDGVIHTTTPNGNGIVKITMNGQLETVPDNPDRPAYSGHFVSNTTNTFHQNGETQTSVFVTKLAGSDGSTLRFQVVAHITINNGGVAVSFAKPRCF